MSTVQKKPLVTPLSLMAHLLGSGLIYLTAQLSPAATTGGVIVLLVLFNFAILVGRDG